jgi:Response regulators consisting of a CheY-like receiver domain and a winged-helix DNA-binding domain
MRVLVVEDEAKVASALGRGLRKHGYIVDISADGVDGLSMATEYDYDAIVLDLMIPGIDGVEVCTELRARGRWAPVLMLSASGDAVSVIADPERLKQALTNLVENAVKYAGTGAQVGVSTWKHDGEVGFTVSDTGPGIPGEVLRSPRQRAWARDLPRHRRCARRAHLGR